MQSSDVNNILQILLNIAFETDVDLLKPSKLLIKRHRFLLVYLTLIAFLSKLPDWYKVTASHYKVFHESISNSYWNYSICQKVNIIMSNRTIYSKKYSKLKIDI